MKGTCEFVFNLDDDDGHDDNSVGLVRERIYPLSDRRWSAKFVPTFADRRVSRSQHGGSPMEVMLVF
jgi:hypothetical protein